MSAEPVDLMPCPFCGGAVLLQLFPGDKHGSGSADFDCACGAGITFPGCGDFYWEAAAAWNKRAPATFWNGLADSKAHPCARCGESWLFHDHDDNCPQKRALKAVSP